MNLQDPYQYLFHFTNEVIRFKIIYDKLGNIMW